MLRPETSQTALNPSLFIWRVFGSQPPLNDGDAHVDFSAKVLFVASGVKLILAPPYTKSEAEIVKFDLAIS